MTRMPKPSRAMPAVRRPIVLGSAAAGLATLWLEWRERFELARYTAAAAVAARKLRRDVCWRNSAI